MFMKTAYVIVQHRVIRDRHRKGRKRIVLHRAYIKSEGANQITQSFSGQFCLTDLCHATGSDLDSAREAVIRLCRYTPKQQQEEEEEKKEG